MRSPLLNVSNTSNLTILSRHRWLIAPVLLLLAASDLTAQSHTSWEMNYGDGLKDLVTNQPLGEAAYSEADIPAEDDSEWEPATDPDVIGFNEKSKVGGNCGRKVDYTYFQTLVTVPEGVEVEEFNIAFSGVDDGSRVTIFNSDYPDGRVDTNSYITLRTTGTKDLKDYLVHGENRVVITLVDNCSWNTLKSAEVTLNGAAISDPCVRAFQASQVVESEGVDLCQGAETSDQPAHCFDRVMHGGINWGGGTGWAPQNAINLCRSTTDADATIECFQDQIAEGTSWSNAIESCKTEVGSAAASDTCVRAFQDAVERDGIDLCQGAETSDQPAQCFDRVILDGVDWGGGTVWNWQNAINLCRGSTDAGATIGCFRDQIADGKTWQEGIASCT